MRRDAFELQRRVDQPFERVQRALSKPAILRAGLTLGFGADGLLVLQAPFRPASFPYDDALHAPAALTSSRGRSLALVRFEITATSADGTELSLRPLSSRPDRWSARRVQQYFALAEPCVDSFARILDEEATPRYDPAPFNAEWR